MQRRLESSKGKERNRSSVENEVSEIILKKFRSVIKYEIIEAPEGKKTSQLRFWVDEENKKSVKKYLGKTSCLRISTSSVLKR
ncbi:hypothetical protein ASJ81_04640 [Methanosarcina spelaei]|uniref:Uncharacterized protein n=1 Tax=Methanosarcina spelaei TaxID=1036679 RepID=A0A2A2HUI5_9EURY|nr:hypothetical protein ASJ81_04640 [Methanosarcina spelaei]